MPAIASMSADITQRLAGLSPCGTATSFNKKRYIFAFKPKPDVVIQGSFRARITLNTKDGMWVRNQINV